MAYSHQHGGHRARLRNRFAESPESFADHEILELLLFYAIPQKDTNALAHELLNRFGSVAGVVNADPDQLQSVPGMGETSSQMFSVILEVFRRYLRDRFSTVTPSYDPAALGTKYLSSFLGLTEEKVVAIALNEKGVEIASRTVGRGDLTFSYVQPTALNSFVLKHAPCKIVIAHNHPSGIALPSEDDLVATDVLGKIVRDCGGTLIDHLIFDGKGDFVSLGASGQLNSKNRFYYKVSQFSSDVPGGMDFTVDKIPLSLKIMTKDQTSAE